jgi:hypothetical protein
MVSAWKQNKKREIRLWISVTFESARWMLGGKLKLKLNSRLSGQQGSHREDCMVQIRRVRRSAWECALRIFC